jgi:hypothetical protein
MNKPRVNRPAVAEWVTALRSGDYKQGHNQLGVQYADGRAEYCCLGVACEIFTERLKLDRTVSPSSGRIRYNDNGDVLPSAVMTHLGFTMSNPEVWQDDQGFTVDLAQLNDDLGMSFAGIADVIEREFLGGDQ